MIELHILQCLFVRGSNKKQRRGRIISNLQKERLFYFLWQPSALGVISQCGPLLAPSKKGLPLPFSLAKNRKYLDVQLKGELTDLFWKLPGCSVFPRVRIGSWILLYQSTLPPHVRNSSEDKSMLFHFRQTFLSNRPSTNRIYLSTHLKERLTNLFWSLPGYSVFSQRQSRQDCEHFANG